MTLLVRPPGHTATTLKDGSSIAQYTVTAFKAELLVLCLVYRDVRVNTPVI